MAWTGYNTKTNEADAPPDLLIKAWQQFDPKKDDNYNSRQFREADLPAVNGHGNARAIAKLYAGLALGGSLDGFQIIKPEALKRAVELQWFETEPVLTHNYRMGMGFTLNSPDAYMGPNLEAFGHVGAGGSTGFADPKVKLGFSYGMNRMYPTRDNGPRARRLIEATYRSL
jgi:CubicO group peptidase (beta-lactamase class C family)